MNAMNGFEYKHNNKVTIKTSFGAIELTYVNRDMRHAESPLASIIGEWLPDDTYPAKNHITFFEAALIDAYSNRTICIGAGVTAESAIKDVIERHTNNRVWDEIETL